MKNAKLMQSERNLNPITFHFNYGGLRVTGEWKNNCKSECKSDLHYISFYVLGLRFYWVCVLAISLMPCIMVTILIYHPLMPCIPYSCVC
jgi:hypothetical protein